MAGQLAHEADFFSVGTNDLTKYTLAMDRGHPKLAPQVDALNPAVLQLINLAVNGACAHDRWVGVCGGIAGDLESAGVYGVMRLPNQILHLIVCPNADQYAAEMAGQLA